MNCLRITLIFLVGVRIIAVTGAGTGPGVFSAGNPANGIHNLEHRDYFNERTLILFFHIDLIICRQNISLLRTYVPRAKYKHIHTRAKIQEFNEIKEIPSGLGKGFSIDY